MATPAVGVKVLGINFAQIDAVQKNELGLEVRGNDGRTYKYVKAGAAIALGDALISDGVEGVFDYQPSSAADQSVLGVWPADGGRVAVTDNYYFWCVVGGYVVMKAAATVVVGAPAITTATAGTVDDTAATAANALATAAGRGLIFQTTTTAGLATVLVT